MEDCLFCKIVKGEIKGTIVQHDDEVTAFRDINPAAATHILIVPNRHIPSVAELTLDDAPLLARLFQVANKLGEDEGLADRGYRLVINKGRGAGQSVFHLHIHLLGGRPFSWPPG